MQIIKAMSSKRYSLSVVLSTVAAQISKASALVYVGLFHEISNVFN